MSTQDHERFMPQEPPADFADRVVRAMLEERRPQRRNGRRVAWLALAAVFVGASAWAGFDATRRTERLVELPETREAQPTGRAEASTRIRHVSPERIEEPEPEAAPAPRPRTVVAPPPATAEPPPEPTPPRRVYFPRCDCATGGELCGCIE
jgi:hypothetical protein